MIMNKVEKFVRENFDKVKKSGDNYIVSCPFHDDKSPSLSIHDQNGYYLCFSCNQRGNFKELSEKVSSNGFSTDSNAIIPKETRKSIVGAFSQQKKFKKDKNFNEQVALVLGYIKHTKENWDNIEKPNHWKKEVATKNVCWDWHTSNWVFYDRDDDGDIDFIKWHKGKQYGNTKSRWFPAANIKKQTPLLVITEGEKDFLSIESIRGGTITSTTGAKSHPTVEELKDFEKVLILYDNDEPGITGAEQLAYELALQKIPNVYIAEWGDVPEGFDATDATEEQIKEAIANCKKYDLREKLDIFTIGDFLDNEEDEQEIIVDKVMTRGGVTTIAGSDGVGKSFLALQFALACATGTEFLGFKVNKPYKVLLVQFELSNQELRSRLRVMYNNMDATIKNPGLLDIKGIGENSVFVDNWTMIDGSLISNDYDVLIVDNLYTSTEKDVQNNQELAKLLSKIALIKNKYDIGIMLINHHTKMTQETKTLNKDMIRGGKSFTDFVSNSIQVAQSNLAHDLKIFKLTKCRSQQADILNVPFCMEFDEDTLHFEKLNAIENESVHYVDIKKKPEFQAFKHLKSYATAQTINSKKYPAILNIEQIKAYIEGELGRNPKTTYAWINRLIEFGLFERVSHGHYLIKNYKYLDTDDTH